MVAEKAIQELPLPGLRCVLFLAFQSALLWEENAEKKGVKRKRRNKGKLLYTEHYQVGEKSFNL